MLYLTAVPFVNTMQHLQQTLTFQKMSSRYSSICASETAYFERMVSFAILKRCPNDLLNQVAFCEYHGRLATNT